MPLAQFYSPDEVAQRLSVSARAIHDWIKRGRLKAYKVGGAVRISETDVESMLEVYTGNDPIADLLDGAAKPDPSSDDLAAEAKIEAESLTERIRKYAFNEYIQPCQMNGVAEIDISVSEVHKALKLHNRYAAVCNALERRFAERYGLKLIREEGPEAGAKTYCFSLRG